MRISDWSSDVCSSDLLHLHRDPAGDRRQPDRDLAEPFEPAARAPADEAEDPCIVGGGAGQRHDHRRAAPGDAGADATRQPRLCERLLRGRAGLSDDRRRGRDRAGRGPHHGQDGEVQDMIDDWTLPGVTAADLIVALATVTAFAVVALLIELLAHRSNLPARIRAA